MNTYKSCALRVVTILIVLSGLSACDSEAPSVNGDFLPLNDNFGWSYQQWLSFSIEDSVQWSAFQWKVSGDTEIEGKIYKKVIDANDGHIIKVIRKEGSKYYGRNHDLYQGFTHEYVFLDTDIPVGGSWFYFKNDGATKTEYVVKAKNITRTIEGTVYHNVIELDANYYNQVNPGVYELQYSTKHHYAKGIGEVYSFYPYPASGTYGEIDIYLISYHK